MQARWVGSGGAAHIRDAGVDRWAWHTPVVRFLPAIASAPVLVLALLMLGCSDSAAGVDGATIGDTLDAAGTQRVTLVAAEVSVGGAESRPPPDGSVYASFLFRIESLSPDARYDPFRFAVIGPAGERYPYTAAGLQPALGWSGVLSTGKTVEGWVSFVVPDDFESLAVSYDPLFGRIGQPISFVVRAPESG